LYGSNFGDIKDLTLERMNKAAEFVYMSELETLLDQSDQNIIL